MLYYPVRQARITPQLDKTRVRDFMVARGPHQLHAWWFTRPDLKTKAVFLLFHGNGGNMSTHFVPYLWLPREGIDFVIFDYEGYGASTGSPSPENCQQDGKAVMEWIASQKPNLPLVIYGQSLGGAIALSSLLELKDRSQIKLVVIDSSFVSYQQVSQHVLAHSALTWLFQPVTHLVMSDKYAPKDRVRELASIPTLVMHGTHDKVVDFELGRDLYLKLKGEKEFWTIPGGKHCDALWRHRGVYRAKLAKILRKLPGNPLSKADCQEPPDRGSQSKSECDYTAPQWPVAVLQP